MKHKNNGSLYLDDRVHWLIYCVYLNFLKNRREFLNYRMTEIKQFISSLTKNKQ